MKEIDQPNTKALEVIKNLCSFGYGAPSTSDFQQRLRRNIHGEARRSRKKDAWNAAMIAILTTQQQSGPGSKPAEALHSGRLTWRKVAADPTTIGREVRDFRFNPTKQKRLRYARTWLNENWQYLREYQIQMEQLGPEDSVRYELECEAADFLLGRKGGIPGIGPKQARNFWQYLGYTVWTIPLDSRVQRVLRAPPFSLDWGEKGLTESNYLQVEQQIGRLCSAIKNPRVYPVLLDSVLFNMEGLMRDLAGFPRMDQHGF